MKTILFTLLVCSTVLAGNGGGTMMVGPEKNLDKLIIYKLGEKDSLTKIAIGKLKKQKWEIEQAVVDENTLSDKPELSQAIKKSEEQHTWVELNTTK